MKSTDKLRKYVIGNSGVSPICEKNILKMADAIEQEVGDMLLRGYAECHDELLEGNEVIAADLERCGWMRLPVDVDGVPVHVGDVMEWPNENWQFRVNGIGNGTLFYIDKDSGECGWTQASNKRHVQPDTWERIIQDAMHCDQMRHEYDPDAAADEFAALVDRCRALAGDADA